MSDKFAAFKEQLRKKKKTEQEDSAFFQEAYDMIPDSYQGDILEGKKEEELIVEDVKLPEPFNKVLDYIFNPAENITVYEMAKILSFTIMSVSQDTYDVTPENLRRHFVKFETEEKK